MAKKGQQVTDNNNTPSTTNDTGDGGTPAPKGKKQKKTYN